MRQFLETTMIFLWAISLIFAIFYIPDYKLLGYIVAHILIAASIGFLIHEGRKEE